MAVRGTFRQELEPSDALDQPLWQVARSAAELLTEPDLRLHQCAGANCTYLFADRTRNGRRRWCEVCGNLAKVRRHRQRLRMAARENGGGDAQR